MSMCQTVKPVVIGSVFKKWPLVQQRHQCGFVTPSCLCGKPGTKVCSCVLQQPGWERTASFNTHKHTHWNALSLIHTHNFQHSFMCLQSRMNKSKVQSLWTKPRVSFFSLPLCSLYHSCFFYSKQSLIYSHKLRSDLLQRGSLWSSVWSSAPAEDFAPESVSSEPPAAPERKTQQREPLFDHLD